MHLSLHTINTVGALLVILLFSTYLLSPTSLNGMSMKTRNWSKHACLCRVHEVLMRAILHTEEHQILFNKKGVALSLAQINLYIHQETGTLFEASTWQWAKFQLSMICQQQRTCTHMHTHIRFWILIMKTLITIKLGFFFGQCFRASSQIKCLTAYVNNNHKTNIWKDIFSKMRDSCQDKKFTPYEYWTFRKV